MLPANLAKTRAAGRGAYGELFVLNPAAAAAAAATSAASALRYAPYPVSHGVATLPAAATVHHAPSATLPLAAITLAPASTPLHYTTHALYDVTGCKRVFATTPTLRPMATRGPPTLTYSMSDLLGVQGLDISTVYTTPL